MPAELVLLGGLRQLTERLIVEMKIMGATIDIAQNEIRRTWVQVGQESIVRGQMETKSSELPKWVDERQVHAKLSQAGRWSKKLLTAETLAGLLGKK